MTLKRFKQDNLASERQSESLQEFLQSYDLSISRGRMLREKNSEGIETELISLSTTPKEILHKLGRVYTGFLVLENSESVSISNNRNDNDNISVIIKASGDTVAKIWVF